MERLSNSQIEEAGMALRRRVHGVGWDDTGHWLDAVRDIIERVEKARGEHMANVKTVNIDRAEWERLKAFEKAHTPTDDEREALDYAIRVPIAARHVDHKPLWELIRAIQDSVLAAGFRRSEVPEPSAEMIERLRDRIEEARDAVSTAQHNEPTGEPSALAAVKEWVSDTGDFTAAAESAYIKGFEDAQEIVRGLIQAHTEPQGEPSDALTIPRPHVPYGPVGIPEHEADADYLDHAASNLEGRYEVGGSNVRATVVRLLRDVAVALRAAGGVR